MQAVVASTASSHSASVRRAKVNIKKLLEWRNESSHYRLVTREQTLEVQLMVGGIWHSQEDTCVPQSGATRPEAIRELERELARLVEEAGAQRRVATRRLA